MTRRLPLTKQFPGRTVARFKVWFEGSTVGVDGPIAPELARLIIAAWFGSKQDSKLLARLDALAREIQGLGKKKTAPLPDRSLRERVGKARAAGLLGRKK
jgi:hypothetical protein